MSELQEQRDRLDVQVRMLESELREVRNNFTGSQQQLKAEEARRIRAETELEQLKVELAQLRQLRLSLEEILKDRKDERYGPGGGGIYVPELEKLLKNRMSEEKMKEEAAQYEEPSEVKAEVISVEEAQKLVEATREKAGPAGQDTELPPPPSIEQVAHAAMTAVNKIAIPHGYTPIVLLYREPDEYYIHTGGKLTTSIGFLQRAQNKLDRSTD